MATSGTYTPTPVYQPPAAPGPAPYTAPVPLGPPRTNPYAIVSLVCALVPFAATVLSRVAGRSVLGFGFGLAGLGAILAIVFGAIALGQIKRDPYAWTGRGLALAGLILGIVEIGLVVVGFILALLLVAAFAAACASCAGSSKVVPVALLGLAARSNGGPDRTAAVEALLAHHPACSHFEADTVSMGAQRVCRGCLTMTISVAATALVLGPLIGHIPWEGLVLAGLAIGSVQFASVVGRARTARAKTTAKVLLGVGIAAVTYGIWASPWPASWRLAALAAGWLAGCLLLLPRRARLARHRACPAGAARPAPS